MKKLLYFCLLVFLLMLTAPSFAEVYWVGESSSPIQTYNIQWSSPWTFGNQQTYSTPNFAGIPGISLTQSYQYPQNSCYRQYSNSNRNCNPNSYRNCNPNSYRNCNSNQYQNRQYLNNYPYYPVQTWTMNQNRNCYSNYNSNRNNNANYYQPTYTYNDFSSYKPQNNQYYKSYQPFSYGQPMTAKDFETMFPDRFKRQENQNVTSNNEQSLNEYTFQQLLNNNGQWLENQSDTKTTRQNERENKENPRQSERDKKSSK